MNALQTHKLIIKQIFLWSYYSHNVKRNTGIKYNLDLFHCFIPHKKFKNKPALQRFIENTLPCTRAI